MKKLVRAEHNNHVCTFESIKSITYVLGYLLKISLMTIMAS